MSGWFLPVWSLRSTSCCKPADHIGETHENGQAMNESESFEENRPWERLAT